MTSDLTKAIMHSMRTCITTFLFLLTCVAVGAHEYSKALKDLLGSDFDGAKIVGVRRGTHIAAIDLKKLRVNKLEEFKVREDVNGLSRPFWSPDGKQIIFSYDAKAWLMKEDGSNRRQILKGVGKVYEPFFWTDPETGDRCIVYKNTNDKNELNRGGKWGRTYLARPRTAETKELFDLPCDSGISLDGTHLGDTYARAAIIDLVDGKVHKLDKDQTCNGSMSPDNTYRLMYLYIRHDRFGIRNKYGKELWTFKLPPGSDFVTGPRWSNHPDFCSAVARFGEEFKIVIIQISTKKNIILKNLDATWNTPLLWLPSGEKRAAGGLRGPVMTEELAERLFEKVRMLEDVVEAEARCSEIMDRLPGTDVAKNAKDFLESPGFKKELSATPDLKRLLATTDLLVPVSNSKARFSDPAYFRRNRSLLVRMVHLSRRLRNEFAGTRACGHAKQIADTYSLPENTDIPISEILEVEVVIDAVSRVPAAAEISPYREAVTFIRYRVERVVKGEYEEKDMVVVHWGMKDARHTAAAGWRRGMRQKLKVDRFDAHPKLRKITFAADANSPRLIPFWALEVRELK